MKELYTSPEMKIVCFAPAEKLANSFVNFDDFFNLDGDRTMETNGAISGHNDLDVNAAMDPDSLG